MDKQEKTKRITFGTGLLMLLTAALFDLLDLIPFLNIVVTAAATCTFVFWFMLRGVSPISPRRLAATAIASIVQVFPIASWLPGWIAYVIVMCVMTTVEDKTGIKLGPSLGAAGASAAAGAGPRAAAAASHAASQGIPAEV